MVSSVILFGATLFLAYSNGANDNFKGVATLFGSSTMNYHGAIWWATLTTVAGSIASLFLSETLVTNFSGKGLVPDAVAGSPHLLMALAIGAGVTVMVATALGLPISTTHSLTGALVGAGFAAVGSEVNFARLGSSFFVPLLASPFIALALGGSAYVSFKRMRIRLGISKEWCICLGQTRQVVPIRQSSSLLLAKAPPLLAAVAPEQVCMQRYAGDFLGINVQNALDIAHYLSAGVVSFARGVNDTPKIVTLLLAVHGLGLQSGMVAVALGIAVGGLLNAKKVAATMSHKITHLNHGQGFTANLVTGALVVFASRLGVPVSTTHVSVGSLFGIGLVTRQASLPVIREILFAWVATLPVAALLGGAIYWILK